MSMTPEERERVDRMDRQMVFLAEHQAQLSVNLDRLRHDVDRLKEVTDGLVQVTVQHSERFNDVHRSLERLEKITEEQGRQLTRTDHRLNMLIGVVERYFSGGERI